MLKVIRFDEATYLGTQTISHCGNLRYANTLEVLYPRNYYRVHGVYSMRIVAIRTFIQPLHKVKAVGHLQWRWVAVEGVNYQTKVTLCGEGISHEFAVLPDTIYIR